MSPGYPGREGVVGKGFFKGGSAMKIALVGSSGYAERYLTLMEQYLTDGKDRLCAVIDPNAASAPRYNWFVAQGIPLYDTLEAFYQADSAELVIICSPIGLHAEHAIAALAHSHVLCEKPLAAIPEEGLRIRSAWERSGKLCGVGFQWSYTQTMQQLKADILAGRLGRPLCLKTYVSWKRNDQYYASNGWKGRLRDAQGRWVMDSIAMNAVAHYIHNVLFLLGERMDSAALPEWVEGSVYRGRPIESFDTIFLRGGFANGARMVLAASHVGEQNENPRFVYEFEKAVVTYDEDGDQQVHARFSDGTERNYGCPSNQEALAQKLLTMLEAVRTGGRPLCGVDTALPHLWVCSAVNHAMPVRDFPSALIAREDEPPSVHVQGLCAALHRCYEEELLPDEQGCSWAAPTVRALL